MANSLRFFAVAVNITVTVIVVFTVVCLVPNTPMRYICTSLIAVYALGVIEDKIFSGNKLVRVSNAIPVQN